MPDPIDPTPTPPPATPPAELPAAPEAAAPAESDATHWRGKALEAQATIAELETRLADLRGQLDAAQGALTAMTRRREVEAQLLDAKARDVETALMLVEQTLAKEPGADVRQVVDAIKSRKPHLFEPPALTPTAPRVSSAPAPEHGYASAVERAYSTARAASGARRSLLDYLRAKRRA